MTTKRITQIFLGLMALAFMKVGVEALIDPKAVLAQVGITLENPSALSSMRAVYGGMHLFFGIFCAFGIFRDAKGPLEILILYTAGFIVGRTIGIVIDGKPNDFVTTWLITEIFSFVVSVTLWRFQGKPSGQLEYSQK